MWWPGKEERSLKAWTMKHINSTYLINHFRWPLLHASLSLLISMWKMQTGLQTIQKKDTFNHILIMYLHTISLVTAQIYLNAYVMYNAYILITLFSWMRFGCCTPSYFRHSQSHLFFIPIIYTLSRISSYVLIWKVSPLCATWSHSYLF